MNKPIGPDDVTIIRTPGRDHFGDPIAEEPGEVRVPGCCIQPASSSETTTSGDTVVTTVNLWMPAGTDVRASDHVRFDNADGIYAVDGEPARWVDWSGHEHHVQVQLRRVEG